MVDPVLFYVIPFQESGCSGQLSTDDLRDGATGTLVHAVSAPTG